MKKFLDAREKIYDRFHASSALKAIKGDAFAAYVTSMYLLQDTGETLLCHIDKGFSNKPLEAYLEFWGVMQALIIQQDATKELYKAVTGKNLQTKSLSAWNEIRDKRNICAGHPANRSIGVPKTQRAFMGRSFGNYSKITYELWTEGSTRPTHPTFNLKQLIAKYETEAVKILSDLLVAMKAKWK